MNFIHPLKLPPTRVGSVTELTPLLSGAGDPGPWRRAHFYFAADLSEAASRMHGDTRRKVFHHGRKVAAGVARMRKHATCVFGIPARAPHGCRGRDGRASVRVCAAHARSYKKDVRWQVRQRLNKAQPRLR